MQIYPRSNLIPSQRIPLFTPHDIKTSNSEELATNNLLEISNEDYRFDLFDSCMQLTRHEKQKISFVQRNIKSVNQLKKNQNKQQGTDFMSKTSFNFRKHANKCLSGQEVCVMRKQRAIHLSNFVVLDGNQLNSAQNNNKIELEDQKSTFRIKPPKNIVAFIRKRNIAHLKEQFNSHYEEISSPKKSKRSPRRLPSPIDRDGKRINMSCQLKKTNEEQVSPTKYKCFYNESDKGQDISPDFRCNSPSFRHKRVTNYLRYRSTKFDQK